MDEEPKSHGAGADELTDEEIDAIVAEQLEGTPDGGIERCPECGSTDLYVELGGHTGYKWHCKGCDYLGAFVIRGRELVQETEGDGDQQP